MGLFGFGGGGEKPVPSNDELLKDSELPEAGALPNDDALTEGGVQLKGDALYTRHSLKVPKEPQTAGQMPSAEYEGISEAGVELAKDVRAKEIMEYLDGAKPGTVLLMSGVSEQVRTGSTMRAYGDEIKDVVAKEGREDVIVLGEGDIVEDPNEGYTSRVKKVVAQIEANPDKKFVITFPLQLGGMGMTRWMSPDGKFSEYTNKILAGRSESEAMGYWLETGGKIEEDGRTIEGPNPQKTAEEQLQGINRLSEFAHKQLNDRPITVGSVGHSFNIDALAVYLSNNGVVDSEGWKKLGGMSKETEMIRVELKDGGASMKYGDRPEMQIAINQTAPEETTGTEA